MAKDKKVNISLAVPKSVANALKRKSRYTVYAGAVLARDLGICPCCGRQWPRTQPMKARKPKGKANGKVPKEIAAEVTDYQVPGTLPGEQSED